MKVLVAVEGNPRFDQLVRRMLLLGADALTVTESAMVMANAWEEFCGRSIDGHQNCRVWMDQKLVHLLDELLHESYRTRLQ